MQKIYPFKFLDSYTAEDTNIFWGRDEEIEELYQMVFQTDIILLYGPSGAGKTSLIKCGLASRFQSHDWLDIFIRRHSNINDSLKRALENQISTKADTTDLDWLNNLMMQGNAASTEKKNVSAVEQTLKNIYLENFRPIYLIFDQFEELFILGSEEEQQQFIENIQNILKVEQPITLIFSIREEYLGNLYEFEKVIPELMRKKMRIEPMNLEKVKDVITGISKADNLIIDIQQGEENAIAELVFEKIRGDQKSLTIQLPYLQVFLDKIYRSIANDKTKNPTTPATFTLNAIEQLGDIGNILRDFLDEQTAIIAREQNCKSEVIWQILSPFVTIDGTKEPIGIDALVQHLYGDIDRSFIKQILQALINNRIIRYFEEEDLYEVAHDTLALHIAEKRSDDEIALIEVRNLIKTQSALKGAARELFSEKQLNFIEPFLNRIKLNDDEHNLIKESHLQVNRNRNRRRMIFIITAIITIIVIVVLTLLLLSNQEALRNETKLKGAAIAAKTKAEEAQRKAELAQKEAVYHLNEVAFAKIDKLISDLAYYQETGLSSAIDSKKEEINTVVIDELLLDSVNIDALSKLKNELSKDAIFFKKSLSKLQEIKTKK